MNPTSQPSPLYSLVIVTYNQEKFIAQTIRAALAQTYPNLEIIISDDASTDQTWKIIQAETQNYCGQNKIILNRNTKNIGLAGNTQKALDLSHGEILILNDGDDISLPNRVKKCYETFSNMSPEVNLLWSNHEPIDGNGKSLGKYSRFWKDVRRIPHTLAEFNRKTCSRGWWSYGTVFAFKRCLLDRFDPLASELAVIDATISFRALLLGRVEWIEEVLVQYRTHTNSITNSAASTDIKVEYHKRERGDYCRLQTYGQALIDTNYMKKTHSEKIPDLLHIDGLLFRAIKRQIVSSEIMSSFPNLSLRTLWKALPYPGFLRHFINAFLYKCGFHH